MLIMVLHANTQSAFYPDSRRRLFDAYNPRALLHWPIQKASNLCRNGNPNGFLEERRPRPLAGFLSAYCLDCLPVTLGALDHLLVPSWRQSLGHDTCHLSLLQSRIMYSAVVIGSSHNEPLPAICSPSDWRWIASGMSSEKLKPESQSVKRHSASVPTPWFRDSRRQCRRFRKGNRSAQQGG